MRGPRQNRNPRLFHVGVNSEERLDPDHPRRKIAATVDFALVRPRVANRYGIHCAHRGTVPPRAITPYCHFKSALRPELAACRLDAPINFLNYQWPGPEFQKIVAWFFGDRKLLPMVAEAEDVKAREFWRSQSKARTGIEVVDVRKPTRSRRSSRCRR